jgi:flagella basal body P-ring formation protein FlgA
MTLRMLLILLAALAPGSAQCLPVSGERILAGDMARAVPVFAGIAPDLELGYAPAPGARRTYSGAELARLARRYGLAVDPGMEACFARPVETLTRDHVAAALLAAMPAARLEVLEFSHQPVPPGEVRFPLSGLGTSRPSESPLLWRGAVSRPGQADFPVWARVRIRVSGRRTIAVETLPAGRPILRAEVREEDYEGPPGFPDLSQVLGRTPRRSIPAGAVIEVQWLEAPADVARGERVQVEVRSGRTRLLLEGQAQSSGRRGAVIAVRNPANGKVFRATVADRGRVTLTADPRGVAATAAETEGDTR